jgi:CheY-like chemotaxis protein
LTQSVDHLLIVEDDDLNYELFEIILRLKGFRLTRATNGGQAQQLISKERPDLVIMDVGLPDMDGIELAERIRHDHANADLPIVCVTGHAMPEDVARAGSAGVSRCLTKPINTRTFAHEINEILAEVRTAG